MDGMAADRPAATRFYLPEMGNRVRNIPYLWLHIPHKLVAVKPCRDFSGPISATYCRAGGCEAAFLPRFLWRVRRPFSSTVVPL